MLQKSPCSAASKDLNDLTETKQKPTVQEPKAEFQFTLQGESWCVDGLWKKMSKNKSLHKSKKAQKIQPVCTGWIRGRREKGKPLPSLHFSFISSFNFSAYRTKICQTLSQNVHMCFFFTSSKCVLANVGKQTHTFKHTYTASASGFRYLVVCGEVHWRPAPIGSSLPALVLIGDLSARPSSSCTQTHHRKHTLGCTTPHTQTHTPGWGWMGNSLDKTG